MPRLERETLAGSHGRAWYIRDVQRQADVNSLAEEVEYGHSLATRFGDTITQKLSSC